MHYTEKWIPVIWNKYYVALLILIKLLVLLGGVSQKFEVEPKVGLKYYGEPLVALFLNTVYWQAKIQVFYTFHKFHIKNMKSPMKIENMNDLIQHLMPFKITFTKYFQGC